MLARRVAKELEKSKHGGIYEPELSRIWPHSGSHGSLRLPSSANSGVCRLRYYEDGLRNSSIKGRLPELLFTQVCLTFRVAGAHASCFGLRLRSPLRAAAITHRKNRVRSTSMFPFLDYAPTERADDPKITLSAPALHQRRYRIQSEAWFHCSPSVVSSLERSA